MRTATTRFASTVTESHRLAVTVDVLFLGYTVLEDLPVLRGTVTLDRSASSRGRVDLTVGDPTVTADLTGTPVDIEIPGIMAGELLPYGYELAVKRGVTYDDGTTETVGLGVFLITQSERAEPDGTLRLTGIDRSQFLIDARFEDAWNVAAGTNYLTAIQAIVESMLSFQVGNLILSWSATPTPYTTPVLTFAEQDERWKTVVSMASSCGCELFFDGDGVLVFRPEPDLTLQNSPNWEHVITLTDGAGGVIVSDVSQYDRAPAFNRMIVTGENSSTQAVYRAVSTDLDPGSPTYYYGPFGPKPRWIGSGFVNSNEQAQVMADSLMAREHGIGRSLDLEIVPNPTIEPGDFLHVTRPSLGLDEFHIVDAVTIPLDVGGTMKIRTRARQADQ